MNVMIQRPRFDHLHVMILPYWIRVDHITHITHITRI
jgi:hypothetical protein